MRDIVARALGAELAAIQLTKGGGGVQSSGRWLGASPCSEVGRRRQLMRGPSIEEANWKYVGFKLEL